LLTDGLGSVRAELVSDTVGVVTTYSPYGNLLAQSGTTGTEYGFTGERLNSTTNLLYLRARYFSPMLRVFMSVDPYAGATSQPQSQHPYSYVHNNPVNHTDPSGECIFGGIDTLICGYVIIYLAAYAAVAPDPLELNINWNIDFGGFVEELFPDEIRWLQLYNEACTIVLENSATSVRNQVQERDRPQTRPAETTFDPYLEPTPRRYERSEPLFYFVDLSTRAGELGGFVDYQHGYPIHSSRSAREIAGDLLHYSYIQGVGEWDRQGNTYRGLIGAPLSAERRYLRNPSDSRQYLLMGRKFEAERALWYAHRGMLRQVTTFRATPQRDLRVSFAGEIEFVEVKWGFNGISDNEARRVVATARTIASALNGKYLLEANGISPSAYRILRRGRGEELPYSYR
jgi:RHS repeat-associated protein